MLIIKLKVQSSMFKVQSNMPKEITFDKFIRWAGVVLIVFAVLYITNYLSEVLLPFVIAWFFAYLLYPVVKFIENKLHIKVRALSIILAMGAAIAVVGGVLWLIIPPMIDQFDKLGEVLTRWLHQTTHTNNLTADQGVAAREPGTDRTFSEEQGLQRCPQDNDAKIVLRCRTNGKHHNQHRGIHDYLIIYVLHSARL